MQIIICKDCKEVIDYMEAEKVSKLYSTCPNCHEQK